jgi:O-antigen/teichoic acid export membrane protein
MSEDISYRQRRYLIMMSFRAICFGITILLFLHHFGWLAAIPAVFAIVIPYVAVVFANGGREPDNVRGFMEYRPKLPELRIPPGQSGTGSGSQGAGDPNTHS